MSMKKKTLMKRIAAGCMLTLISVTSLSCLASCGDEKDLSLSVGADSNEINSTNEYTEINKSIRGLNYSPEEVIAFNGLHVGRITPKSGVLQNNKYVVVNQEKCEIRDNFELSVPTSNLRITYPGALILANNKIIDGNPQPFTPRRGSVTLTLDLSGMSGEKGICVVPEATYDNVLNATNEMLNKWYAQIGGKYQFPANMSYQGSLIYDEKQAQLAFGCGCDQDFLKQKLGIDFDAISRKKKSVYLLKYTQVFYTVSVKPFFEPADAFADTVTVNDLFSSGMNNENPPAYVGNVVYGREIFVKVESSAKAQDLAALMDATASRMGVMITPEVSAKFGDVMRNTNVSIVALGGTPLDIRNATLSQDTTAINAAILNNVELSEANPAFPLTYEVVFLKDNIVATFGGSSEYIKETIEEIPNGELHLKHDGAYIARFYVTWDEITGYDSDGNEIVTQRQWDQNGVIKTAGFKTTITLGGNCRNICIKAQGKTGLEWDPWHTPIDEKNLPLVPNRTVRISGTTLNQKANIY